MGLGAAAFAYWQAKRPAPTAQQTRAATLDLLQEILPAERSFEVQLWDGTLLPATRQPSRARLVLNSEKTLGRMLKFPLDLAMGEGYLRGDFEIEGDIGTIAGLADDLDVRPEPAVGMRLWPLVQILRRAAGTAPPPVSTSLDGDQHSRGRDKQAIEYHYDVSNDFYKLWLDQRMLYSCAYFPQGAKWPVTESLDQAEEAKLDLICRQLRLRPGEILLDIGCGWGGLAIYAAQHYQVRVVGITLSESQLHEAQERVRAAGLEGQIELEIRDYRDLPQRPEKFDKIVSIEMAEHVGRKNMATFFGTAHQMLRPGGKMVFQATGDGLDQAKVPMWLQSGNFARKYVFPDGELLPIWETLKYASEAHFEVHDLKNMRDHYSSTLRYWLSGLENHQAEAQALLGEQRYRLWRIYLGACIYYFQKGHLTNYLCLFSKLDAERRTGLLEEAL